MRKICVFAGSSTGNDPEHADLARQIGAMAAARGLGIVYGGGRIGLMGALADGATSENGFVHGVIPKFLETLEVAHQGVTELTVTETMQQRKTIMYYESDAFLALPGGFGTMEELLEITTQRQLKLHNKPIVIFNHKGYWDNLVNAFHSANSEGFIRPQHMEIFQVADSMDELGDFMDGFTDKA